MDRAATEGEPQLEPKLEPKQEASDDGEEAQQQAEQGGSCLKTRDIKTRFPVARIKRLMQSDEDIGKVAQATPIVVAKALELFMVSLVDESCSQAKMRNSKRVTPSHLKEAVTTTEVFDFLRESMDKYPDPIGPANGDNEEEEKGTTKRGRGRSVKQEE